MKKFLNICFRFFPDEVGGSKRFIFDLNKFLVRKGNHSFVFTAQPAKKKLIENEIIENIKIERYELNTKINFLTLVKNFKTVKEKIKKINLTDFDFIFFHHPFPSFFFLFFIKKNLNIKKYLFFYGPWYKEYLIDHKFSNRKFIFFILPFVMKFIEIFVMKKMDKIIVLSEYSKKLCIKYYGINSEKIILFSGCVDLEKFKRLNLSKEQNEQIIFLTIRRLEARMGIDNLIKAIKLLKDNNKSQYEKIKVLIGGDGSLKKYLENLTNKFGLSEKIIFLGFIPESQLCEIYNSADFFILPSIKEEGFGMVLPESISCGCIPLGTNVAAIPEFFKNYSTKFLINGFSENDIYEKIKEVLTLTKEEKEKYIEKGLKLAEEKYNWEKLINKFLNII
ncbi:MAG TPA: glycosyltransferase family 4 protein [bacterium]|nr:glycosyltransferase family 4 protein [bacterium]HOL46979.1 glycosyltransferase family 4 protein [bacterium]HPQ19025.1 glycosyltransferase family 4 protein [bacterium]